MDRDTFIITVYCLVEEHDQHLTAAQPIRHGGFAPQLSDGEVITMVICGEFFKLPHDTDLFAYFRAYYAHFFPPSRIAPSAYGKPPTSGSCKLRSSVA